MKQDEINKLFKDMNKVFDEADKLFNKAMSYNGATRLHPDHKPTWEPVTLWWPKRIKGKWFWPTETVYRKFVLSPGGGFYLYGDDFDFIKDAE
jgi:hypothetical protein